MSIANGQLLDLANQCLQGLDAVQPTVEKSKALSTRLDYMRTVNGLLRQAKTNKRGLLEVLQDTARPSTFYKRVAALRYFCFVRMDSLLDDLRRLVGEVAVDGLAVQFSELLHQVQVLVCLQQQGMTQERRRRRSKRQALAGLPFDWRTLLYQRGCAGKYGLALLVSALTGARPYELVSGVEIWRQHDETLRQDVIHFKLMGAKVKAQQGQPERVISYASTDSNPLVVALVELLRNDLVEGRLFAQIENAANFTVEIRRLAKSLWPEHRQTVTAYCFRHQWSADLKAAGDADAVSRGLGHVSAKTRRYYGTAGQSRSADQLRPVHIDAARPIKGLNVMVPVTSLGSIRP